MITCSGCRYDNPSTAHFCHVCGAPVTRPTATAQEFDRLIKQLESSGLDFPLDTVRKLGQLQSQAAVPALLALYKRYNKGLRDNLEVFIIFEALISIGAPTVAEIASKLASRYRLSFYPATLKCHEALVRLGKSAEARRLLRSLCSPNREDTKGSNLRYVVQLGQLGEAEDIARLSGYIMEEKRRWDPGIGYWIAAFDPISLVITATFSVAANVINRAAMAHHGKSGAAWMVSTADLMPSELEKLPAQVRKMVAMHCYSTALAELGQRHSATLQSELHKRKKPLECAVLGLALAQQGDKAVVESLGALRTDSDWAVRILVYEGLITLAQETKQVAPSLYLSALQENDLRVRVAIAKVLADTQDPAYAPHILKAVDTDDKKQRQALVPIVAQLSRQKAPSARAKLQALATGDPDNEVRAQAQAHARIVG